MKKYWLVGVFVLFLMAVSLSACTANAGGNTEANKGAGDEAQEAAKPSNGGGPGDAINLQGDATKGAQVFQSTCQPCHGAQGVGNVSNPGSKDGTVPPLNPIDSTMVSSNTKTFATNIDLFLEHGSTPEAEKEGTPPALSMPAFGDQKKLQPQQIADVIAYVISLNKK